MLTIVYIQFALITCLFGKTLTFCLFLASDSFVHLHSKTTEKKVCSFLTSSSLGLSSLSLHWNSSSQVIMTYILPNPSVAEIASYNKLVLFSCVAFFFCVISIAIRSGHVTEFKPPGHPFQSWSITISIQQSLCSFSLSASYNGNDSGRRAITTLLIFYIRGKKRTIVSEPLDILGSFYYSNYPP